MGTNSTQRKPPVKRAANRGAEAVPAGKPSAKTAKATNSANGNTGQTARKASAKSTAADADPEPEPQRLSLPEPTVEQLAIAFRHLRTQLWPNSLQAAIEHPVFGVCLRQAARNVRRVYTGGTHRPRLGYPDAPIPPTPSEPRVRIAPPRPGPSAYFDRKRAAANDRD